MLALNIKLNKSVRITCGVSYTNGCLSMSLA